MKSQRSNQTGPELARTIDGILETVQAGGYAIERAMKELLAALGEALQCESVFIKIIHPLLQPCVYSCGGSTTGFSVEIAELVNPEDYPVFKKKGKTLIAGPVQVGTECYGFAGFIAAVSNAEELEAQKADLAVFIEQVDNYFASVVLAARKQTLLLEVQAALNHPVLREGIKCAVEYLAAHTGVSRMFIYYWQEDPLNRKTLNYYYYRDHRFIDATEAAPPEILKAAAYLNAGGPAGCSHEKLSRKLGITAPAVFSLGTALSADRDETGWIIADSPTDALSADQLDCLDAFASSLRMRIIDFGKEHRLLSQHFSSQTAMRMLNMTNYHLLLEPQEREVAILYCDISGFSALCEQILKTPRLIGDLISEWSARVVQMVWDHGGVFDKMVGDCVIAMFGPPFYDTSAEESCSKAIRCAEAIRQVTRELGKKEPFCSLIKPSGFRGLGVASGINFTAVFIGRFGPNQSFTAFSRGMNETARLQDLAEYQQIFVTESVRNLVKKPEFGFRFSSMRSEPVKNLSEPLRFYELKAAKE
ncbi:MAG: adenylate/guanylate cyclase domain-containing protein [Solirubrobacterales bacterium]